MFGESKYSNILTVLLVIVIVVIICLLIFLGIDVYNKYYITKETSEGVAQFNNRVDNANKGNNTVNNETTNNVVNNVQDRRSISKLN